MAFAEDVPTYKCVLVGDGGIGKTTFVKRFVCGEFEKKYVPTNKAEEHVLNFNTNRGAIRFTVWDTSGQETAGRLRESYYKDSNCAILMYDVTSKVTYKNIFIWLRDLESQCKNIPIVVCGNKVDVTERKVLPRHLKFKRTASFQNYEISAKSNLNIEKPFLWLSKKLLGYDDLEIVEMPALQPADVILDKETLDKIAADMKVAEDTPLPDLDDDDCHNAILF